jgi:hypothetical protein
MPTHEHRVTIETVFSYEERMIVAILVEQLNLLRVHAGLAPLTAQALRQEARDYVRAHPRGGASA